MGRQQVSGILPEMLKAGIASDEFLAMHTDLVGTVWQKRHALQEWVDAILVPIPIRKASSTAVRTGEEYPCWTLWARW